MRGDDRRDGAMFSYVSPEARVPKDPPLRRMVDTVLTELSPEFDALYSRVGRPSIHPEKLLRALLLQALYTVRAEYDESERPTGIGKTGSRSPGGSFSILLMWLAAATAASARNSG